MNKPLVLVVEDDTPVRNLITTTLKTHEYRYLSAQNGASAVMEALSHNPDIVLLENEFVEKKKWLEKSEFLDMVAVAESTPGPVAINSATYIGYKIAGFAGATMSTLAVCIPSFFVIYGISLFFDQFLSLRWVSCAFRGIQVCVIYLILTAGLKMLKSIDKNTLNLTLLTLVMASMLCCSITAVSFSSVFYILICGAVGLVVFFLRKIRKGDGKTS